MFLKTFNISDILDIIYVNSHGILIYYLQVFNLQYTNGMKYINSHNLHINID